MKIQIYIEKTLTKNNTKKENLRPIYLICTEKGKRFWLNTQIMVSQKFKGKEIPICEDNAKVKQVALNGWLNKIEQYELLNQDKTFQQKKSDILAMFGKEEIQRSANKLSTMLCKFADEHQKNVGTRKLYYDVSKWVNEFDKDITYNKVDKTWIERFFSFMTTDCKTRKLILSNTANGHLSRIYTLFEWCIDNDLLDQNPFRKYKRVKYQPIVRNYLTIENIKAIRDYDAPNWRQQKYLDLFMLSFYLCGLSEIDILTMTEADTQGKRLIKKRHKSGTLINIPICMPANKIIRKYKGQKHLIDCIERNDNINVIETAWNKSMKLIGKAVGVPTLKVRDARSAFASIAASIGCSQEDIALCLAHSWANVTARNYIGWDYSRVDKVLDKVLKALQ